MADFLLTLGLERKRPTRMLKLPTRKCYVYVIENPKMALNMADFSLAGPRKEKLHRFPGIASRREVQKKKNNFEITQEMFGLNSTMEALLEGSLDAGACFEYIRGRERRPGPFHLRAFQINPS